MASSTEICNIALISLGAAEINDINDGSKNAKTCLARYATARDAVLRSHPWNCATKRFSLPVGGAQPAFEFTYAYNLPTDPYCLRVYRLLEKNARFKVEGRQILTNVSAPLRGWYIGRIGEADMDALLSEAIGMKLAHLICYRVTTSAARTDEARKAYELALREARSVDAMEGTPEELPDSELLASRY